MLQLKTLFQMHFASICMVALCGIVGVEAGLIPRQSREVTNVNVRHRIMGFFLGPLLSQNASISFSGDSEYVASTQRWSQYGAPNFATVVEAHTENDVAYAVKMANLFGLQFLAVSGQHGGIDTLGAVNNGVQIHMTRLNDIEISEDGTTANIGGGSLSKHITDTLWAQGKQTVTGACECTSLLGPMLGGGHGWLQGRYGLAIDQLEEARVVLSNGTAITVSDDSHPDLFWGLRGAGHNFGIVTSVRYKVYDVPANNQWTYANLIFTQDTVEDLFNVTNTLTEGGNQPVEFMEFIWYVRIPEFDAENPVMILHFLYEGDQDAAAEFLDPYRAVGPVNETVVDADYTMISSLTGNGNDGIACIHGEYSALRFPIGYERYNLTTQRRLLDRFGEITTDDRFNGSFYLFESYSVRGVVDVEANSTAFPDRFNHHLTSPVIVYYDSTDDADAVRAGQDLRAIALDGKPGPHNAYVNYAHGDETPEDWYGHESWRMERLRDLKQQYDPRGLLSYYAPIS